MDKRAVNRRAVEALVRAAGSIGYPIIEVFPDGSFIVTKHAHTGGAVYDVSGTNSLEARTDASNAGSLFPALYPTTYTLCRVSV